jgi:hypothetical protein
MYNSEASLCLLFPLTGSMIILFFQLFYVFPNQTMLPAAVAVKQQQIH